MADVRLVNRWTGSVAVVPEEKAAGLSILGFEPEKKAAFKSTAKKSSSSKSSKK